MNYNDFVPYKGLDGGHRMTLYTWGKPRYFPNLPQPIRRYFDVSSDARVLAHCHWQPNPRLHPTLIALHGLEGSSKAHYMRGLADKAYRLGLNVVLLNQRNCGDTEHLSQGLYHSGLSADPAAVIQELIEVDRLNTIGIVGYSLGGNVGIKLAGDYGSQPPPPVRAICAVSPTMNLGRCVDALESRENAVYEWNFVRNLKKRMRRKGHALPGMFDLRQLDSVKTVREFDEMYTAPHHGFNDASDYYYRASSLRVVDKITIPTLILSAKDDPFVPHEQFSDNAISNNLSVTTLITDYGGHCGFYTSPEVGFDGYWAEQAVVNFIVERTRAS